MKVGMPGYHANETCTAEFWESSTRNMIPLLIAHLATHDPKSIFDQLTHEPLPEVEEKVTP